MRRLWPLVFLAGCGGSGGVPPPANPFIGSYSGSWDMPTAKQFGTATLEATQTTLTGDFANTVTGKNGKIVATFWTDFEPGHFDGTLKYAGQPAQLFTGEFVKLQNSYQVFASLDFKDDPTKKFVVPLTMTLDKQ